jgi:hypothetical protein
MLLFLTNQIVVPLGRERMLPNPRLFFVVTTTMKKPLLNTTHGRSGVVNRLSTEIKSQPT